MTAKKDSLPIGVSRIRNKFRACCGSKYLGLFATEEQAFAAYVEYARAQRGYENSPVIRRYGD